ncbi:hypothetical protein [Chryseosolibacter indicus]|uniref:PA14 domain-containing protein n=1 Tax=Chryseosolibacter indicus TaxID=2782351 RepID=A0ABS5VY86_9BACT|nr:hypothetical protein [Chryseosolibacter indicus]MBT1706196.1 hypothetical protein [Chryseosolibacter indicus]
MKRFLLYILLGFSTSYALAQNQVASPQTFPDSVSYLLEGTRNLEAKAVGTDFAMVWASLSPKHQQEIRKQYLLLRKKKFAIKPHVINYLGAIINAVNVERVDDNKFSSFLDVSAKVIENNTSTQAANFFAVTRTFFLRHALHYEKPFRLLVTDDEYVFDYIAPPPPISWNDTTQFQTQTQESDGTTTSSDDSFNESFDTTFQEVAPLWMNPPPPPNIDGAVLKFTRANLIFVTPYDSTQLKNTKGTLSLTQNLFVGEGGRFDWSAALLNPDSVYCDMHSYYFGSTKCELKADLVNLNYLGKTPGAVPGSFEFKSQPRKDSVASSYPRFKSYQSNLEIQGLGDENLKYWGGFSLTGNKISSQSFSNDPSTIEVYNQGQKKFRAQSPNFIFNKSSIASTRTYISLYHDRDSIVHNVAQLKYAWAKDSTQRLILQKDKGDMRHTPFSSSYFNIDFSADIMKWDLYADSINVRTDGGRNVVPLIVESVDYYDPEDYKVLQGVGFGFHPLAVVVNYALKKRVREFYSGELASYTGRDLLQIKKAIEFLYQKGMVSYDPLTDLVKVKPKAVDIYLSFRGEVDYDNLKIHSVIDTSDNATINLKKGYMTVRGVEEFHVSDSLNVRIEPDSSVITILRDRDIKFDGMIDAGNFKINGKGFMLKYDSFYIDLKQIDSINFYVTEKNAKGIEVRRKIDNSMVGADSVAASIGGINHFAQKSGTLYISKANNKSGKVRIPNYPRLDASSGGVIYFDRPEVLGGVYDRSMFFVVPPFKLDSLNDADPASINFDGTFVSSGMFPNFKEKLHTQPDKSLGFDHSIPQGGYQLYQGDGKMHGIVSMNARGLRGFGEIEYLAANVSSQEMVFYPDSVIASGRRARIAEKQFGSVLFPQASLSDYSMKWVPKEDKMRFKNQKGPFSFYDSTAFMQGTVTVSKNGVAGMGKLETRGTELISRDMRFAGDNFSSRHARFKVRSEDPNKPLFTGNDIRLRFNLKENYADISPEIEGVAAIDFPYAQFKTSIPNARWDLDEQKIVMSKDPKVDIENSYFYTTRKELDSLHFNAEKAEYNLKTQELKVSGIPYIVVADAQITPENNEVLILENARIGTLKNTTIVLDTLNAYHRLTEGVVDIVSRKEFSGYATYQYVNLLNDTFAIKMTDFHLEPIQPTEGVKKSKRSSQATMQTVAMGAVSEQEHLVLGAGLFYKGNMIMYATRPALQLDGFVKLDIRNIENYNAWLEYKQSGEETEVRLDFNNLITEDGKKASAGLHFDEAGNDMYLTFFNDRKSEGDEDFFTPAGSLVYDKEVNEYRIEDKEKAEGKKLAGKVFAYNDEKRQVRFEGPVNLFTGAKGFSVTSTALGTGNLATNEFRMNSFLMIESNIPSSAFDLMAKNLQEVIKNEGASEGLGDQTELLYKIGDIIGERAVKEYEQKSQQGYVSLGTLPQLAKQLVFADVNLKWHPKAKAFYNEGNLGVSNIGRNDINGGFEGFMEIRKTEEGVPVFHVFIKASPEAWYYFGFEDNRLMVHSSNGAFNDIISKKSNAGKAKVGEVAFIPGSEDETLAFINRYRKQYYGIEVPYSLNEGPQVVEKKKEEEKKEEDDGF